MSDKIRTEHLQRKAYVYIRQSSEHQVRHHKEGQLRQYGLSKLAESLGFSKTVVIDDDLGRSGTGRQERPGFARLLAVVCEGAAGAVLALEASRLARNNRDWHHLIDLCTLTGTLIIDEDGIYDPRLINDRLLLGLKGTMSEFEISLMRQRGREAFEQKIKRGHALWVLPIGYVRTEEDRIEKIADRQVQEAIEGVFKKFRELGTARQTLLWYRDEQLPLPEAKASSSGNEIIWRVPKGSRIHQILKNPCYAGALAYGKSIARVIVRDGRSTQGSRKKKPMKEWKVLIFDNHAGYITWEAYLENQRILEGNAIMQQGSSGGAAKRGAALLSGLLRCGRCGRKIHVAYGGNGGRVPRYLCHGGRVDRGSASCLSLGALRVDQSVSDQVLEAIQPAGIEAALAAMEQVAESHSEKRRALELALEKARYESSRAQRQYDTVDPENRLVAGELERRWNETLRRVEDLQDQALVGQEHIELTDGQKQRMLNLGSDVSLLWNHPAAPVALKKRILRTVLHEIIVDNIDAPPRHALVLHWEGGTHTKLVVPRNAPGHHRKAADRNVIELVRELSKVCSDRTIAATLNRLGYRTGTGKTWRLHSIWSLRHYHRLLNFKTGEDWLTIQQVAETLKVSATVIRRLIRQGHLPANQVVESAPWIIKKTDLENPVVLHQVAAVRKGRKPVRISPDQQELPLK